MAGLALPIEILPNASVYDASSNESGEPPFDRTYIRFADFVGGASESIEHKLTIGGVTHNVLEPVLWTRHQVFVGRDGRLALNTMFAMEQLHPDAIAIGIRAANVPIPDPWQPSEHVYYTYVDVPSLAQHLGESGQPLTVLPSDAAEGMYWIIIRQILPIDRDHIFKNVQVDSAGWLSAWHGVDESWEVAEAVSIAFIVSMHVGDEIRTSYQAASTIAPSDPKPPWTEMSVDLGAYVGQTVDIVLSTRLLSSPRNIAKASATVPSWGSAAVYNAAPERDSRPNLVLISLDTLRADRLATYGCELPTDPVISLFAEQSVVFEQCISAATWTIPSHGSVFTGVHPFVHGAGICAKGYRLRKACTTIAELARRHGYLTAAITDGGAMAARFGFDQGFDVYHDGPDDAVAANIEQTVHHASTWIERYHRYPFFLFVHTYQVHDPYIPPEAFLGRFGGARAVQGDHTQAKTPQDRAVWASRYDEEIAYTDATLAKLFDSMAKHDLYDNTLVVVFSDHGEEFWEHGRWGHMSEVYQELLHVPLLIRFPRGAHAGTRIPEVVALQDVYTTIADYMGWTTPDVESYSLLSLLSDSTARTYDREYIFSVSPHQERDEQSGRLIEWVAHAVRDNDYKAIFSDRTFQLKHIGHAEVPPLPSRDHFEAELYDLAADPHEKTDLSDTNPERVQEFWIRLQEYLRQQTANPDPGLPRIQEPGVIRRSDAERLEAMGYL